jgi:hypothetical protein
MKSKRQQTAELEDELSRLTALVRERRKTLDRLDKCPNKDCECRFVWREHVEKTLASQMGKIRSHVRGRNGLPPKAKTRAASSKKKR